MLRDEQKSSESKMVGTESGLAGSAIDAVLISLFVGHVALEPNRLIGTITVARPRRSTGESHQRMTRRHSLFQRYIAEHPFLKPLISTHTRRRIQAHPRQWIGTYFSNLLDQKEKLKSYFNVPFDRVALRFER